MEKTMTLNLRVNPTVKQQAEDAELLQHILGLLLNAGADPDVQHHRFFHGYHLEFIVMLFALQVNRVRSRN